MTVADPASPAAADADSSASACQRPRFVFVVPWGLEHAGGVNQVVLNLAREFQMTGPFEPVVWVTDWSASTPVYFRSEGLRAMRWRLRPPPEKSPVARFKHWLWRRRVDAALSELADGQPVAVINAHYPGAGMLSLSTGPTLRHSPALLASFHGTDVDKLGRAPSQLRRAWTQEAQARIRLVTCSHDLARRLSAALGETVAIDVVHNGVRAPGEPVRYADAESTFARRSTVGAAPRALPEQFLLCVGRFSRIKGIDVLLDAYDRLGREMSVPDLVLVGATDAELEPLQSRSRGMGLEDRVWFVRDVPHDQMSWFYRRAKLFVLPSRSEAMPLVLLEAGSHRVPIVATHVGGVPEVIADGETGLLVPPDDPDRLAVALRAALVDEVSTARRAALFQERVAERFSWGTARQRYVRIVGAVKG